MPDSESPKSAPSKSALKPGRLFFLFMLFVFVVFCVAALGIGYWFRTYCPPIKLEKATPEVLTGWLLLRDFRSLDAEIQEGLLREYLAHFGPGAPPTDSNRIYGMAIKIAGKYAGERNRRVATWGQSRPMPNLLRGEYMIIPRRMTAGQSEYVRSADIVPTDGLRRNLLPEHRPQVPKAMTKTEGNCRILTRRWFQLRMKEYDQKADAEKLPFLESLTEELDWWQNYYNGFLVAMGLPADSELELMRELSLLVSSWYAEESESELAKLLWFKDLVISFSVMKRLGITDYGRVVPLKHGGHSRLLRILHGGRLVSEKLHPPLNTGDSDGSKASGPD